jgi:hypothetical protein
MQTVAADSFVAIKEIRVAINRISKIATSVEAERPSAILVRCTA